MKRALAIIAACAAMLSSALFAADFTIGSQDAVWIAPGYAGKWTGDNWYFAMLGGNGQFIPKYSAYFTNETSVIDLDGANAYACSFRFPYATAESPASVTLSNGTLAFDNFISPDGGNHQFQNMVLTAGAGANLVNAHATSGIRLNNNTHLVIGEGATLSETSSDTSGNFANIIGYDNASSNSLVIAGTATFERSLRICAPNSLSTFPTGVVRVVSGGVLNAKAGIRIAQNYSAANGVSSGLGVLEIEPGAKVISGAQFEMGGNWHASNNNAASELVVGGELIVNGNLYFGEGSPTANSLRHFVIDGGKVDLSEGILISNDDRARNVSIEILNGGELSVSTLKFHDYTGGPAMILNVDGGTIKAKGSFSSAKTGSSEYTQITVGEGGFVFDTQEHEVIFKHTIKFGTGTFAKKGSGYFEFNYVPTFPGSIDVSEGLLGLAGSSAKVAAPITIRSGAGFKKVVAFASEQNTTLTLEAGSVLQPYLNGSNVPTAIQAQAFTLPATGTVTLRFGDDGTAAVPAGAHPVVTILGAGTFSASDLAKFTVASSSTTSLGLSADAKSILLYAIQNEKAWTGAAGDGKFSTAANWVGNSVPVGGEALYFINGGEIVNDLGELAASSITFCSGVTDTTISGGAFVNVGAVTNLSSSVSPRIDSQVRFAGDITVKQNAMNFDKIGNSHVTFAGGAYAASGCTNALMSTSSWAMFGHYHFDNVEDEPFFVTAGGGSRYAIADNSSLTVPFIGHLTELSIGNGSALTAGVMKATGRLGWRNFGEFVITNYLEVTVAADVYAGWDAGLSAANVFKIEKAVNNISSQKCLFFADQNNTSDFTVFIGKGGLTFTGSQGTYLLGRNVSGNHATLRPWYDDFTVEYGSGRSMELACYRAVEFNTDDENGIGRTITVNGRLYFDCSPDVTVSGSGKLLINRTLSTENKAQPPVTVKDTATLAFGADGLALTTSTIAFHTGTTLQLPLAGAPSMTLGSTVSVVDAAGHDCVYLKLGEGTEALSAGKYSLFKVTGAITDATLSKFRLVNPTEGNVSYNFNASSGDGLVSLYVGSNPPSTDGACLWTGAAGDCLFSTAANWQGGRRPQDVGSTAAVYFNIGDGEITNDVDNLSVASITFGKTAGALKLCGKPISGVSTVSNSGTVNHEIALALSCDSGTPTIPKTTSGYVLFSGGFTAPTFSTASGSFWGKVTMTSSDQWTSANMNIVQSGAELTIPNTVSSWTQILEGGRMNAGTITRNGCERHNQWKSGKKTYNTWWALITDHLSGTVRVGEVKTEHDACAFQAFSRGANGIIIADKLTCASPNAATGSNPWFNLNCGYYSNGTRNYSSGLWAIGPGGLTFGTSNHGDAGYMVEANTTLKSFADWSVDVRNNGWAIYGYQNAILTIDTDHYFVGEPQYDDGATVHTVTINGSLQDTLGLKVTGGGKVVFNNDGSGFKNGVTVEDSATFAINAGKKPGTGAVTLNNTSRLLVPEAGTGTATIGGALTFNTGTSLVVSNLTEGVTPLTVGSVSGSGASLTVEGDATLADGEYTVLSLASGDLADTVPSIFSLGGPAIAGKNASLSVSGGNLVLTVDGEGAPVQPSNAVCVWTGAGGDGLFSTAANWQNGVKPVAGVVQTLNFLTASGALVNDIPGLTPTSITFGDKIGELSISGEGFSNVGSVVNNSASVTPVLNTPVAFSGNVTYTTAATMNSYGITGPTIDFAGGASGAQVSLGTNKKYMKGVFDWTSASSGFAASVGGQDRMTVGTNSTVTATAAGCGSTYELFIMPGGSLIVSNKTVSVAERAWCWNMGKFIVLGKYSFTSSGNQYLGYTGNATSYGFSGKNLGSFWANTISVDGTGVIWLGNADASTTYKNTGYDIYVGEGGMQFGASSTGTYATPVYCYARIHPWGSDFTVMAKVNGDYSGFVGDYYTNGDTEFVTTDADGETPRTITMNGIFTQNGSEAGNLVISGNGTFVQNGGSLAGKTKRSGSLTVTDTATLKFGSSAAFIGTGPVTMAAGTTLAVPATVPGEAAVALGSSFTVDGEGKVKLVVGDGSELAAGDYAIFALTGDLPDDIAGMLALQNATADAATFYSPDGKTLRLVVGGKYQVCEWTGAAGDGKFSTPGNWLAGYAPVNGSDILIPSASGTIVNDIANLSLHSMTFGEGIGELTISGNAISGMAAITNLSTAADVIFAVPVAYVPGAKMEVYHGGKFDNATGLPSLNKGLVIFAGGVTGEETMDNSSGAYNIYAGRWTRTSSVPWTYAKSRSGDYRHVINEGSSLTVGSADFTKELYIGEGGAFTAATVTVALTDGQRLSVRNYGEYVVTECFTVNGATKKDIYTGYLAGRDVFKFEKVKLDQTTGYMPYFGCNGGASQGTFYIGSGGIEFGTGNSRLGIGWNAAGDSQTIRPWHSDFTITRGSANTVGEIYAFRDVVFNTDDENGRGRTITLDARPMFNYTPTFTLSGSGTLLVNSTQANTVQPPVTVTDTATLKFGSAAASLSTAVHTFHAGSTLAVPQVATDAAPVTLGSSIVLPAEGQVKLVIGDGTELADGNYPVLSVTGTLPAGYAAMFALQNPTESAATLYSPDSKTLRLAVGNAAYSGPCMWTGAAGDGLFSNAANWAGGVKPVAGDTTPIVFSGNGGIVVNDIGELSPAYMNFEASLGEAGIDIRPKEAEGYGFTALGSITNFVTYDSVAISAPIEYSGAIDVTPSGGKRVLFSGGVTGSAPVNHSNFAGIYTITDAQWTPADNTRIPTDSVLTAKDILNPNGLQILYGGKLVADSVTDNDGATNSMTPVFKANKGEIEIKGLLTLAKPNIFIYNENAVQTGVLKTKGIVVSAADPSSVWQRLQSWASGEVYYGATFAVGSEGLKFTSDSNTRYHISAKNSTANSVTTIYAEEDFEFAKKSSNTVGDLSGDANAKLVLVTREYGDETAAHTITVNGKFIGAMNVEVCGTGTVKFNSSTSTYSGGTVVKDTATLAFGSASSKAGVGAVTLYGGTTLAVPGDEAVALGTSLALAGAGKVSVVLGGGTALADGDYPVASVTGTISADVAASFELANPNGGNVYFYSADGKTIRVAVGAGFYTGPCVWTGAAGDGKFSTAGNWVAGQIPANGSSIMFSAEDIGAVENDLGELQINAITFGLRSAALGIRGGGFTGVKAVTNLSTSVTQTFFNHVAFDNTISVIQQATAVEGVVSGTTVRFNGGVSGTAMANTGVKMMYDGHFVLDTWSSPTDGDAYRQHIVRNSSVSALTIGDTHSLDILELSSVTGAVVQLSPTRATQRFWAWNAGEFVITNEVVVTGIANSKEMVAGWQNNSVGKFEKITIGGTTAGKYVSFGNVNAAATHHVYIGDGGLNFEDGNTLAGYGLGFVTGDIAYLHPWHNGFEVGKKGDKGAFRFRASNNSVLDTDNEAGEGKGIVFNVACVSDNATSPVVIAGSGYVRYNAVNTHSGTVTVNSGAKLELGAGAKSGTGALTVKSGATISAAESGSAATIGAACTFESDSTLGLKFTNVSDSPKFAFSALPTLSGDVYLKIETADKVVPRNHTGKWTIATGVTGLGVSNFKFDSVKSPKPTWVEDDTPLVVEGDELVLRVKHPGLVFTVR